MKGLIKKLLREGLLDELSTTNKCVYGSGCFHTVYASSKHPDKLYKIGSRENVEEWVHIFKLSPNLFPKIFRVFPSKIDPRYFIVEIEKLNTQQAENDFTVLEEIVYAYNKTLDAYSDRIYFSTLNQEKLAKLVQFVKEYSEKWGYNTTELLSLVNKWCDYLMQITPLILNNKGHTDYHSGNFAYDNQGNIKAIDV